MVRKCPITRASFDQIAGSAGIPGRVSFCSLAETAIRPGRLLKVIGAGLALICSSPETCPAAVVLDQIGDLSGFDSSLLPPASPSQVYPDLVDFDTAVLEDFEVTANQLEIREISVLLRAQLGFTSFQDVTGYLLNIFSFNQINLAGAALVGDVTSLTLVPGSGVSLTQITDQSGSHEFGLLKLDLNVVLPSAGRYWLGVSPVAAYGGEERQFFVQAAPAGVGPGDAKIANPGEGLGAGALFSPGNNFAYAVTAVPEPASIAFGFLGFGWFLTRRRRNGRLMDDP
jgi:hypothetical protein